MFFALSMHIYIPLRPQSVHQWRQTVSLNITLNYAAQSNGLLQPETNHLNADKLTTGIAQGEFPVFYYAMGKIWKITGQQEWLYRVVVFAVFLALLYILGLFLFKETNNLLLSVILPQFLLATPVLAYYSVSFLMDIVALSLVGVGWYFFYLFYKNNKYTQLAAAFLLFTLAGLLKVTLLITPVALLGYAIFALIFIRKKERAFQLNPILVGSFFMLIINAVWYVYALQYNKAHEGWYTENGIYPLWMITAERWQEIQFYIGNYWIYQYAPVVSYVLFLPLLIYFFLHKKKYTPTAIFIYIILAYTAMGTITYVLLWFQVFHEHDYYVIAAYPLFIGILLYSTITLHRRWYFFRGGLVLIMLMFFLLLATYQTRAQLKYRLVGWPNENSEKMFASFFDIEPFLRNEIGLKRTDKVVVYNDPSVCISLYLADQKGWQLTTDAHGGYILQLIEKGATHALINDSTVFALPEIEKVHFDFVGRWKTVDVYKISPNHE